MPTIMFYCATFVNSLEPGCMLYVNLGRIVSAFYHDCCLFNLNCLEPRYFIPSFCRQNHKPLLIFQLELHFP